MRIRVGVESSKRDLNPLYMSALQNTIFSSADKLLSSHSRVYDARNVPAVLGHHLTSSQLWTLPHAESHRGEDVSCLLCQVIENQTKFQKLNKIVH